MTEVQKLLLEMLHVKKLLQKLVELRSRKGKKPLWA